MSTVEREHRVTPLELFFDLVFVFAVTQVTSFLGRDPSWGGALRAMLVLAAVWWGWATYAWLTSAAHVDEGGVRLTMLGAMTVMLGVASPSPGRSRETPSCSGSPTSWCARCTSCSRGWSRGTSPTGVGCCSGSRRPRPSEPV